MGLPLLPHFTRARGALRHRPGPSHPQVTSQARSAVHAAASGPAPHRQAPAALPESSREGLPGHAQVSVPGSLPSAQQASRSWFPLSLRPMHGHMGETGRGLAGVPSRTSSVPRVPPWAAGLQSAAARHPVSARGPAHTSLGGRLAAVDSHIRLALELCDCLPPRPDLPMALSSRAEASFKPPSSLHGPHFLAGSQHSPAERPLLQSLCAESRDPSISPVKALKSGHSSHSSR